MRRFAIVAVLPILGWAFQAEAQLGGLLDRVKDRAQDAAVDSAGKAARRAAEGEPRAKGRARDADTGEEESEKARPARKARAEPKEGDAGEAAAAAQAPAAGEVYGNRFDFVPGDKVVVYDDFSDTDVGEYPARWTMKDGGGNAVEVVELKGRRFLKSRYQGGDAQDPSLHWLRYAPKGDMPAKFTIEFDADLAAGYAVVFSNRASFGGQEIRFNWEGRGVWTANMQGTFAQAKGIQHVSIAVSGTQVKVYVGGERVLIDSDAVERPITRLGMEFLWADSEKADHLLFTAFRLAEGGKDVKTMLVSGRIVTHGILFDTASDVLKPESGPALRSILALLKDDPALAFTIEGHTDSQGGAKVNGPLSERRAEAVKAWLVKQGVEAGRLAARGLGDTKPIDSNETAEGRANNRRVEFVKFQARASK